MWTLNVTNLFFLLSPFGPYLSSNGVYINCKKIGNFYTIKNQKLSLNKWLLWT